MLGGDPAGKQSSVARFASASIPLSAHFGVPGRACPACSCRLPRWHTGRESGRMGRPGREVDRAGESPKAEAKAGEVMGRGMSKLQRFILTKAAQQPRVYHAEVLRTYFGWKQSARKLWLNWKRDNQGNLKNPGVQRFSTAEIGIKRYRIVQATLSRACFRLEARGLVTRVSGARACWSGVEITDKGREFLSANLTKNLRQVNR